MWLWLPSLPPAATRITPLPTLVPALAGAGACNTGPVAAAGGVGLQLGESAPPDEARRAALAAESAAAAQREDDVLVSRQPGAGLGCRIGIHVGGCIGVWRRAARVVDWPSANLELDSSCCLSYWCDKVWEHVRIETSIVPKLRSV